MAAVQVETWRTCYAPKLPEGALDALDETIVEAGWRAAVSSPPSPRHRVLVALAAGRLAAYAAVGPAEDGDSTSIDGEIYTLTVAPEDQRQGHASRLVSASADVLRESGFRVVRMWTFDDDDALHAFLRGGGWAPDGATRILVMGDDVGQQRWHTELSGLA